MSTSWRAKSLKVKLKLLTATLIVVIIVFVLVNETIVRSLAQSIAVEQREYRLSVYKTERNQWAYEIFFGEQLLIRQLWIPGIAGKEAFGSYDQACQTGLLVIEKLKMNKIPAVSADELKAQGIVY